MTSEFWLPASVAVQSVGDGGFCLTTSDTGLLLGRRITCIAYITDASYCYKLWSNYGNGYAREDYVTNEERTKRESKLVMDVSCDIPHRLLQLRAIVGLPASTLAPLQRVQNAQLLGWFVALVDALTLASNKIPYYFQSIVTTMHNILRQH